MWALALILALAFVLIGAPAALLGFLAGLIIRAIWPKTGRY
jgi:Kef-type K+ transport system membrane component KefB